ncbi:hypothetical protein ACWEPH_21665 [Nocardia beijingensis]
MSAEKWQKMAAQARAGELYLDDEVAARECLVACTRRIDDLELLSEQLQQAQSVAGFGDFAMAKDLEAKFRSQASGTDNSLGEVIKEHIATVEAMRDTMRYSIKQITGRDVDNAGNFVRATEQH